MPPGQATKPYRRGELDLIGAGAVLLLVFVHTASIFAGQQLVVNDTASQSLWVTGLASAILAFSTLWGMPLMTFMAGFTLRYSLSRRTLDGFVRDRIRRLLVPFVTGMLLVIPPMLYFWTRSRMPQCRESFLRFYPRLWDVRFSLAAFPLFVEGAPQTLAPGAAPLQILEISHLWFLLYLFAYSLLLLPLFAYLGGLEGLAHLGASSRPSASRPAPSQPGPAGQRWVERFAAVFSRAWSIWLLALPIAAIEGLLGTEPPSAWNRLVWPFFLLYGFLFCVDSRLEQALQRERKRALALGGAGFLLYFGAMALLVQVVQLDSFQSRAALAVLARAIKGFASWFWVVAIMGLATHWGRRASESHPDVVGGDQAVTESFRPAWPYRLVAYAKEAQVPAYVLHQLPVICIGYYVVQWHASAWVKFVVICLSSYLATFLLYEVGVRRSAVTRFLFGMKVRGRG